MINTCTFYGYFDPINYKKPQGFLNALKAKNIKVYHHNSGNFGCVDKISDLLFGETHDLNCDFSKNKFVVFWDNIDIHSALQLGEKFPNTKFVIATKSFVFDVNMNDVFIKKYGCKYAYFNRESIYFDLNDVNVIIKNEHKECFKIRDNVYLTYIPCSLSEDTACFDNNREYDIVYVGSVNNRPNIKKAIDILSSKYKCFSTFGKNPINPLDALEIYTKSKVAIHEQVHPVLLEHPVRVGETRRKGCSFVSLTEFKLPNKTDLIPDIVQCDNFDLFLSTIEEKIQSFVPDPYVTNTYENALQKIFNILEKIK